jgi:predicted aspartyl protease
MAMMLAPTTVLTTGTIGMLAPNYLSHFDVEFDFAAGRFILFSQEHCRGSVVHWTQSAYAVLPFELDVSGHIFITALLDGKPVRAALDTGAERSTMTLDQAHALFGIKGRNDPALKLLGAMSINGTATSNVYRYPFATLTFNGMQVLNPDIEILAGTQFSGETPQLILGMETLRQLHLYIAYGEKAVYLTPAEMR